MIEDRVETAAWFATALEPMHEVSAVDTFEEALVRVKGGDPDLVVVSLDIAREHHPDLILMDIQLPEVSGLEVTKWLKEDDSLKSIPVVAVTAFAMKGDEDVIRQGGCEAYISKPISVTGFLETVRRFIG